METWINKKRRKKIIIVFCPVWLSVSHPLRSKLDNNRSATNSARIKEQEKSRNFNVQVQKERQNELRSADLGQLFVISSSSFRKKSSSRTIHIVIVISIVMLTGNLQFVCRKKGQKSIVSTGGNGSAQLSDNEREKNNRRNRKWWDIWFTSQKHYTK